MLCFVLINSVILNLLLHKRDFPKNWHFVFCPSFVLINSITLKPLLPGKQKKLMKFPRTAACNIGGRPTSGTSMADKMDAINWPVSVRRIVVDRFYIALFSSLEQTHCKSMLKLSAVPGEPHSPPDKQAEGQTGALTG